jgi:gliding motility-associated-like protein
MRIQNSMKKIFKKRVLIWLFLCVFTLSFTQTKANAISSNAVSGNWSSLTSWSGGIVPTKNDTVTIVSGSTITVDVDTSKCYKLKINSGGILNVSSHILKCYGSNVSKFVSPTTYWFIGNGHCTIYSGGTLNLNTGTLCLTGDFITNGTFNCGTGTIVFDTKRAPLAVYGTNIPTFYNVINKDSIPVSYPIAGGFGVTLHNDNTIIKGNLVVDGTFNRNTSALNDTTDITFAGTTTVSGMYSLYLNDVIINLGATLSMPLATSKTIYLYGDWTSNGTFACGLSTIWFSRDPNNALVQNVYQANPDLNPFYNLYTNKTTGSVTQLAGSLNTNGNLYVSNNFTVNKGTWDMGGIHRLYVGGNFVVTSGTGIYTASTGRLLMNGSNAVTPQTLNTGGSSLYKYTIMNTGAGVLQASDVTVTYEIQFTSGVQYTKNGATLYELYLSNNDPTLSLPAGYSATSFIVGKFRRAVTGVNNYSYPVGPLNTVPVKYRPFIYQQTTTGGASNVFVIEDAFTNTGTYYANWWAQIQPDAGTPTGSLNFSYNLSTDFPAGMTECAMSVLRGSIPLPANWNWVMSTTLGASGGNSGTTSAAMPATFSPYAFILGEPVPVATPTSICSGNSTLLVVTSPKGDGTYNWYDAATSGNLVQVNSTSYNTPVLNSTTTYYVSQVNNFTGCATHTTPVTVTVTAAPAVNAGINRSICSGSNLVLSGTSASNYTVLNWTKSGTGTFTNNGTLTPTYTPSAADISAGSVTLTLNATGSAPCGTFNDDMVLTIVPIPTANAGTDATICNGSSTTMSASGGTSYAWSPSTGLSATNISNPVANPTTATNYTVTVTNAGGCSAIDNVTVNVYATVTANAGSDVSIPNGTSTTLSAASGGSGTYTYSWAPSASLVNANVQNPTTTNLSSNVTYTLTVTDNSTGCQKTDQVQVTVTGGALSVTASGTPNAICVGQSVSLVASSSGGFGTYTYTWASNPIGFSLTTTSPSVSVTPTTSTTYLVTVNDGFTSVTGTTAVTVNPLPAANAGSDVAICSGNSTPLSASGGNTYAWSPSTGLNATNISNPTASPTSAITYIVTVTSAQGCQKTDNVTVSVNTLPTANAGSDISVCAGNSYNLSATGGNTYAWGPSTGLSATNISNPIATPASTLMYSVTVTSLQGCTDADDITITVNMLPSANAGADQAICAGKSASLNATGGTSYSWSPSLGLSSPTGSSPIATPANTTSYTVTVTNSNGCSSTDNMTVTVNPVPTANAGTDFPLCAGNSVNLGASGGGSYLWSPSTGLSATNIANPTASPANSITYNVLVTNAQGCTNSDDISITVNPLPLANAGADQSVCAGNTASLNATGGATYVWDHATSLSDANIANPTATPVSTTLYNVTVTTASGCSAIDNVNITVNPLPVANAGSDLSMCNGKNAQLTATGGVLYSWNPTTGLNNPTIQNPVATPSASTVYTVIVTDTNSCSKTDTVSLTVFANPVAVAGADQAVCEGISVNISAIGGTFYSWSTGDSTASFTTTPSASAIYNVTVTDENGCSDSDNLSVTVTPLPVISISSDVDNYFIYLGQLITITASPEGYSNYNFYTDSVSLQSGSLNYFSTSSLQNDQTIYISATENGCSSATDSITLMVKPIPNAFTPLNSDQVNDVFLKGLDITIFNRWGQELYSGKEGWDGKYNGKNVSPGTYYFILKLYDIKKTESEVKGSVTIFE